MKRKYLYTIIIFLALSACEKKTDWQIQAEQKEWVIVDGNITDEQKAQTIKLTRPVTQANESPLPIAGATVSISDESTTFPLTEQPVLSGIYKTDSTVYGQPGKHYTLNIVYQGKNYSATDYMLSSQAFTPLIYSKRKTETLYHIDWVASSYNPEYFAMWEILLDWSSVTGYTNLDPETCKARLLYYTLPTLDVSQVLTADLEKVYFPAGTKLTQKRYSLSPEHAEFIRTLLFETNWQGGLFDSAHGNLATNVSEGGFGFFGACSVATYTTVVAP